MTKIRNYIGGELLAPISGKYIDNRAPATGQVYAQIPDSSSEDIAIAMKAAQRAFAQWSVQSHTRRHDVMMKIAEGIAARHEEFAQAESRDTGKPISLARQIDIPRAVANFKFFATAAMQYSSESHYMPDQPAINYTLRRPVGVVGCISPWNLPLYLLTWKVAPAIATGNTVIAKPSEVTPMTAYLLSQVCQEAGLPDGVLNIVHGTGPRAGEAIVTHPEIKAISFTGGTATGAHIASITAPRFLKTSLELGGKNPTIVFADADYNDALSTSVKAAFANQGQICLCGSRVYIERSIYEQFRDDFVSKASTLKPADPADDDTRIGALVSAQHRDKVLQHIAVAKAEGGKILCGGDTIKLDGELTGGYYLQPTVIEDVGLACKTTQDEIFGPVVTLTPFDTEEELIRHANGVRYGLSTSVWTSDLKRAHRIAAAVDAGIVWINCWLLRDLRTPFGGMKDSGVGREGGWEAMRFFTEPKNVCIKY